MLWLDHAPIVKIQKKIPFVGILYTSDEQAVVYIPPEGTFEVNEFRFENIQNGGRPFPFQNTFPFFWQPC